MLRELLILCTAHPKSPIFKLSSLSIRIFSSFKSKNRDKTPNNYFLTSMHNFSSLKISYCTEKLKHILKFIQLKKCFVYLCCELFRKMFLLYNLLKNRAVCRILQNNIDVGFIQKISMHIYNMFMPIHEFQ